MSIVIAIDANVIMSALLGGKPSFILFDTRFRFITTEFTVKEVGKYLPKLAGRLGVLENTLANLLRRLPISSCAENVYQASLARAQRLVGQIDKKDVDILALALEFDAYLWSQDKHFEQCGYQKVLKTYNFL